MIVEASLWTGAVSFVTPSQPHGRQTCISCNCKCCRFYLCICWVTGQIPSQGISCWTTSYVCPLPGCWRIKHHFLISALQQLLSVSQTSLEPYNYQTSLFLVNWLSFLSQFVWFTLLLMFRLMLAAIGNAFAVLSDVQKRKRYDEYGSDDTELRRRGRPNGYEYDFSRGFEGKHNV